MFPYILHLFLRKRVYLLSGGDNGANLRNSLCYVYLTKVFRVKSVHVYHNTQCSTLSTASACARCKLSVCRTTPCRLTVEWTSALLWGEWLASRRSRLTLGAKALRYVLDRRVGGPRNRSGRYREVTILDPPATRPPTLQSSSPSPVAVQTALPKFWSIGLPVPGCGGPWMCFLRGTNIIHISKKKSYPRNRPWRPMDVFSVRYELHSYKKVKAVPLAGRESVCLLWGMNIIYI
jgi:hypothetical protein